MNGPPLAAAAECRAFTRYLVADEPTAYVAACYERALPSALVPGDSLDLLERTLLRAARAGRLGARIADAYARRFRPYGALRRRLVLLLAILENAPPTEQRLDSAREGSRLGAGLSIGGALLASGACLLAGVLLFGPLHLIGALAPKR